MTLVVTWLWQGTAVACAAALVLRAVPRVNAATRHAVWWLALAAVLALPAAHVVPSATAVTLATDGIGRADAAIGLLLVPAIPEPVVTGALLLWMLMAVSGFFQVTRGCLAVSRLKHTSAPFDPAREARLPMWTAARSSGWRQVELRTSEDRAGACALGLGRPGVILVFRSLADELSDAALDEIVMHERAHLERCDDWLRLLQAVVLSVAGLHPAVRFLSRQIDIDREAACDDRVVACTGAALRYARSLAAAADVVESVRTGLAPGATGAAAMLRRRIDRLLDSNRDRGPRLAKVPALTLIAALTIAVSVAPRLAPVIAFVERPDSLAPLSIAPGSSFVPVEPEPAPSGEARFVAVRRSLPDHTIPAAATEGLALTEAPAVATESRATVPPPQGPALLDPLPGRRINADAPVLVPPPWPSAAVGQRPTESPVGNVPPWSAVTASAARTAREVARTATSTSGQARSAGASIGRIAARVGGALANSF
jgi:beta-lactamase regulating signal transducer with metallopeptidase domain